MKTILLIALMVLSAPVIHALPPRPAMKDTALVSLVRKLQDTEGYSYNTTITSTLLASPTIKKVEKMTTYSSLTDFVNYSKSDGSLFFMCDRGQLRIDHDGKTVYFQPYNDSLLNNAKRITNIMRSTMQDSFFLAGALVDSRKEQSGRVSYQLTYPETSTLRSMSLSYKKGGFFERISYRVDRRAGYLTDDLVRQDVVMDGYVLGMPAEVRSLLDAKNDLMAYLTRTYPGYELKTL